MWDFLVDESKKRKQISQTDGTTPKKLKLAANQPLQPSPEFPKQLVITSQTSKNFEDYDSFKIRRLHGRIKGRNDLETPLGFVSPLNHNLTVKTVKDLIVRTEWLNEEVINTYLLLLTYQFPHVCFLDSYWSFFLATKGQESVNTQPKTKDIISSLSQRKVSSLIIPVHINMNHWVLCYLNFQQSIWTIWDSTGNFASLPNTPFLTEMKRWLENTLNKTAINFVLPITPDTRHQDTLNDYSNCGVWICYYAEQLCMGRTFEEIVANKVENIVVYRSVILVTLIQKVPLQLEYD